MYKVLIIDDDPKIRLLISILLRKNKHIVLEAQDGREGIEALNLHNPDAVLLDLGLPDKNGLEVLKDIKAIKGGVPVIVVTATGDVQTAVKLVKAGAYDYVVKPNIEHIADIVKDAIQLSATPKEAQFKEHDKDKPRGLKRIPFKKNILINGELMVTSIDLSEGGIYVHTGRIHPPGTAVTVTFPPEAGNLTLKADIKRSQDGVGMGLQFRGLTPELKEKIRWIMQKAQQKTEGAEAKTVLFVNDDETGLRMFKGKLLLEGYPVVEAKNQKEAQSRLGSHEHIKAVIINLDIPRLDAAALVKGMRSTDLHKDTPVIVMSIHTMSELIDKVMRAGADEYLPRATTSPAKLIEMLKTMLK